MDVESAIKKKKRLRRALEIRDGASRGSDRLNEFIVRLLQLAALGAVGAAVARPAALGWQETTGFESFVLAQLMAFAFAVWGISYLQLVLLLGGVFSRGAKTATGIFLSFLVAAYISYFGVWAGGLLFQDFLAQSQVQAPLPE